MKLRFGKRRRVVKKRFFRYRKIAVKIKLNENLKPKSGNAFRFWGVKE